MAITTKKLCSLYVNGNVINYNNSPISYTSGNTIELREKDSNSNNQIEFVEVNYGGKLIYISTKNILNNISYNDLSKQALISGNSRVTLGDTIYNIRLLTKDEWNKYILNSVGLTTLITPTELDKTDNGYTNETIANSEHNNIWYWYNNISLTSTLSNTSVVAIGGVSASKETIITKDTKQGYRLVLEPYNPPPTISGKDTTLGNYLLAFQKKYTIYDSVDDFMKVTEYLDNNKLRELSNQVSNTELLINLTDNWSSLSDGEHTIKIEAEDTFGNKVTRLWKFNKVVEQIGVVSTLARPSIIIPANNTQRLNPINGLISNTIEFKTDGGGDLVYYNELNIVDNDNTNNVVYNRKIQTYDFDHEIPSNTLTNGKTYQIKVRTYNNKNQYSQWSDSVLVTCLSPVELIITNIVDNTIESSNPIFTTSYNQDEGEKLYSYQYMLYKNGTLVDFSPVMLDGLLTYQFNNLENKTNYTITITVYTENELSGTLTQSFYCDYLQTRLPATVSITNDTNEGSVIIKSYVRQIIGEIIKGEYVYYRDGEWADLHDVIISFNEQGAFRSKGSFTIQMWAKEIEDDNNFLIKLFTDIGYFTVSRNKNLFLLRIYINDCELYELHKIIDGDILNDDEFCFFIQYNDDIGLFNFDVKRVTKGRNTWFTKSHSNDSEPSYSNENGFLTQLNKKVLNNIVESNIENENVKIYIPSLENIIGTNAYKSFLNTGVIGEAIIGDMRIGNPKTNKQLIIDTKSYYTRTISTSNTNKLICIDTNGNTFESYANNKDIGFRFMIKINSNVKVNSKPIDGYYSLILSNFNHASTRDINTLSMGDKIKNYGVVYNGEVIEFTVVNRESDGVILMSNTVITNKEFDKEELNNEFGNVDWNLSNIKQWLNSNIKIG